MVGISDIRGGDGFRSGSSVKGGSLTRVSMPFIVCTHIYIGAEDSLVFLKIKL